MREEKRGPSRTRDGISVTAGQEAHGEPKFKGQILRLTSSCCRLRIGTRLLAERGKRDTGPFVSGTDSLSRSIPSTFERLAGVSQTASDSPVVMTPFARPVVPDE